MSKDVRNYWSEQLAGLPSAWASSWSFDPTEVPEPPSQYRQWEIDNDAGYEWERYPARIYQTGDRNTNYHTITTVYFDGRPPESEELESGYEALARLLDGAAKG